MSEVVNGIAAAACIFMAGAMWGYRDARAILMEMVPHPLPAIPFAHHVSGWAALALGLAILWAR